MHWKFKFSKIPGDPKTQDSVYGELKLSEKLACELDVIKDHVDSLNEQLEEANYKYDLVKSELDQLQLKFDKEKKMCEDHKREIMLLK